MDPSPLTVAWISDFGLEWLPDLPEPLKALPRQHPLTWQRVLIGELEQNRDLRLHVIVLRKNIASGASFERNGVIFHVVKVPAGLRAPTLFWVDTVVIRRTLKTIHPHVVHAWGTEKGAALVARRLGYPYLVTIQGLVTWYRELVPLHLYWHFAACVENASLPCAPLVTTESRVAVDFLQRKFPRLPVWQAEHAPDWVFHNVQRRPQLDPIRFLFVGIFCQRKGGDLLLSALEQLMDTLAFDLVIVGEPDKDFLEKTRTATSQALWNRIRFKRNLLPAQVAEELAEATMMVFPTRADTSPNAVKEAVVAGVPVVASAVGGITDYVLPGENGLIFPSNDISACVAAIKKACQHPLFGRGMVGPAALAKTRAYLSPLAMGERFFAAYQSVHAQSGRGAIASSALAPI